jgi:hypothetical protein
VGAGEVPGAAPGQILPGDQVISGKPLYGIQPGDDVQTMVRKAWENGKVMITTPQQLAAVMRPPVVVMRTGNGVNGLDPGEQVRISYNQETGQPTIDLIKQGQPANYAVDQANKLRDDFKNVADVQNFVKAKSQVTGAFLALQEDQALHPGSEQATPATQLQLMHVMWQLMNPSATVRQGSIQATQEDPRAWEQFMRWVNVYTSGAGKLTATEQSELVSNIETAYKGLQLTHNETVDDVRNRARLFSIPSDMHDAIATKDTSPTRYNAWNKANPYQPDPDRPIGSGPPVPTAPPAGYGGPPATGAPSIIPATPAAPAAVPPAKVEKVDPYTGWRSSDYYKYVNDPKNHFMDLDKDIRKDFNNHWRAQQDREEQ